MPSGLVPRLLTFVALALAVGAALVLYADGEELAEALEGFTWWVIPPVVLLVLGNYALRFARWQYYLTVLRIDDRLPLLWSGLIFLSGLAMVITPAKAGEWIKSYFLRELNNTPISRSAPLVLMERLTDAWSVALLALCGLVLFRPSYWPLFAILAIAMAGLWAVVRYRPLAHRLLRFAQRLPLLSRTSQQMDAMYDTIYTLLAPSRLSVALVLGFVGWGCEAGALYLVIYGLTEMGDLEVLVKSAFIMSTASLAGALFIVPGGLGVSETGITGLGRALLDLSRSSAAGATLLIRLFTLWFGVAVGLIALLVVARRLGGRTVSAALDGTGLEPVTPSAEP